MNTEDTSIMEWPGIDRAGIDRAGVARPAFAEAGLLRAGMGADRRSARSSRYPVVRREAARANKQFHDSSDHFTGRAEMCQGRTSTAGIQRRDPYFPTPDPMLCESHRGLGATLFNQSFSFLCNSLKSFSSFPVNTPFAAK